MEIDYQLIIIGSGPGGYTAAVAAAKKGLKVAVIEERELGCTCLNRGCIPTKTYLHSSELYSQMMNSSKYGIDIPEISINISAMRERKENVVSELRAGIETLFKTNKIDFIKGRAVIEDVGKVKVNGSVLYCHNIIMSTGSIPFKPNIDGINLENVISSDEILDFNKLHKSLTIIGGGVIGVEIASIYNSLGAEVTIIEFAERILPFADKEISQNLSMIMKKRGIKIVTNAMVDKIEQEEILKISFKSSGKEDSVCSEAVLVATGRKANTDNVFSEMLQKKLCLENGKIPVDSSYMTSVENIYAIGDCIKNGIQLAHVASAQAENVILAICRESALVDTSVIPSCIYTNPEIAYCGMTQEKAKSLNIEVKTSKYLMSANGKSLIDSQERGFIKLVFDKDNVIIGAHLMCARATDLIAELSTAIVNRLTAHQLKSVIRPHPTFSEGVSEAVFNLK